MCLDPLIRTLLILDQDPKPRILYLGLSFSRVEYELAFVITPGVFNFYVRPYSMLALGNDTVARFVIIIVFAMIE